MRRQRLEKLRSGMKDQGMEALVLAGTSPVQYATGARIASADSSHGIYQRTVAVVLAEDDQPHLFCTEPACAPAELGPDHVHPPLYLESPMGVEALGRWLKEHVSPGSRLGVDDKTVAMHEHLGEWCDVEWTEANYVLGPAKVTKTPDEVECIRRAQRINELAMYDVQAALRPGMRQSDLSAIFLGRIFELGAWGNCIDPIWQVMPTSKAEGPYTTNGELAFPLVTTDRLLAEGDVIWCDTGISYAGYASDFGRTWVVSEDPRPSAAQRQLCRRWLEVVDATLSVTRAGASAHELAVAATEANGGAKPWLDHFYLVHGVGTDSAEMPLIGTDLGEDFDRGLVLAPGMVMVLEPVVWEDGVGGYRAEDIVVVTEDGYQMLSDYPYSPYA